MVRVEKSTPIGEVSARVLRAAKAFAKAYDDHRPARLIVPLLCLPGYVSAWTSKLRQRAAVVASWPASVESFGHMFASVAIIGSFGVAPSVVLPAVGSSEGVATRLVATSTSVQGHTARALRPVHVTRAPASSVTKSLATPLGNGNELGARAGVRRDPKWIALRREVEIGVGPHQSSVAGDAGWWYCNPKSVVKRTVCEAYDGASPHVDDSGR